MDSTTQNTQPPIVSAIKMSIPTEVIDFLNNKICPTCSGNNFISIIDNEIHFSLHDDEYIMQYDETVRRFLGNSHICDCCSIITDKYKMVIVNTSLNSELSLPPDGYNLSEYVIDGLTKCSIKRVEKVITMPSPTVNTQPIITKESLNMIFNAINLKLPFAMITAILNSYHITVSEFLSAELFKRAQDEFGFPMDYLQKIVDVIVYQRVGIVYENMNDLDNYKTVSPDISDNWSLHNNTQLLEYVNKTYNLTYGNAIIICVKDVSKNVLITQFIDEFKGMLSVVDNYSMASVTRIISAMILIGTPIALKVIVSLAPLLEKNT